MKLTYGFDGFVYGSEDSFGRFGDARQLSFDAQDMGDAAAQPVIAMRLLMHWGHVGD